MQPTTTGTPAQSLPPFDYPPTLRPCYAIAQGTTADDLARLLGIRLGHLCATIAMVGADGDTLADASLYLARECRELFVQIQARRAS